MSRIYGKKDIDSKKVRDFFEKRVEKEVNNLMEITSFQESDNLNQRQAEECEVLLDNIDFEGKKILEISCGLGRWAEFFHDRCDSYLGIDYAEKLIDIACENYNYDNCSFQVMSATDINIDELLVNSPFIIIMAI